MLCMLFNVSCLLLVVIPKEVSDGDEMRRKSKGKIQQQVVFVLLTSIPYNF